LWWAVQSALSAALLVLPDVDQLRVTRLGIDEHRYRSVGNDNLIWALRTIR